MVLALSLPALPAGAEGPSLSLGVVAARGGVRADVVFLCEGEDDPAASVRNGLESLISFTLRCYEQRPGLASVFGDTLLAQRTVVRVAFYDPLEQRYVVEQNGARTSFPDAAGFRSAFFTLRDVELLAPGIPNRVGRAETGSSRYVAVRAQYDPVRLSPPLTILTLFGVVARHTTPWVRQPVPPAGART